MALRHLPFRMMSGMSPASIAWEYSQAHTSATLAAQAASRATVSVSWTRSQGVWRIVLMAGNIRRFCRKSLGDSFSPDLPLVRDSEAAGKSRKNGPKRTDLAAYGPEKRLHSSPACNPDGASALT